MKRLSRSFLAVFMAVLMGMMPTVRAFAAGTESPDYISEVKIFMGDYSAAQAEGFTLLKEGGSPVDLNRNAGGGLGSKGEKAVYLGYKTTKNRSEAITDLALMNMKGGYSVKDYEYLMETQMKAQIVPLVDRFLAVINEYRENYKAGVQRAVYINGVLNKFIDDDTGKGLGDLLLNKTVYEIAKPQYDALSDEDKENTSLYDINKKVRDALPEAEKNDHADILTIIAQSNGRATLMMENLLTRAADTNDSTWLERFSEITYDDLIEQTGLTPTDARKKIAKLYDDSANTILDMWTDFQEQLLKYDECQAFVESYDDKKLQEAEEKANALNEIGDDTPEEEALQALEDYETALAEHNELLHALKIVALHDALVDMEYGDDTLLDFFMQSYEDIEDDITVLYPLVASLSKGQKAGLEFVSLEEMLIIAISGDEAYSDNLLDALEPISVYDGVDRSIYEKDAVALTNDALRADFAEQVEEDNGVLSGWTIAMWAVTGALGLGAVIAVVEAVRFTRKAVYLDDLISNSLKNKVNFTEYYNKIETTSKTGKVTGTFYVWDDEIFYQRASLYKWLSVGFTVAMVVMAGISVYLTYRDLQEHYNVAFTAIPRYMVEEKDIVGYNKKGEKIILKNQSAYYKAIECNRTESDEFYAVLGTCADMNGDVGRQWLALYSVKKELMEPILASSLKVISDSSQMPAGYETGIHIFGSDAAFNLNSSLYDWNNSAPSVYVVFQTENAAASSAGTIFTVGTMALSGGTGLALGSVVTALFMKKKKKDAVLAENK